MLKCSYVQGRKTVQLTIQVFKVVRQGAKA